MVTICIQPSADATGCKSSRSRTMGVRVRVLRETAFNKVKLRGVGKAVRRQRQDHITETCRV
eukprot:743941-Prymnesium_polylepis.1